MNEVKKLNESVIKIDEKVNKMEEKIVKIDTAKVHFVDNDVEEEEMNEIPIEVHYNKEMEDVDVMIIDTGCPMSLVGKE